MATDIELVIKIPDILMEYIVKGRDLSEEQNDEMAYAITDGIPLPKGHGRIADMDEAIKCIEDVEGEDAIWAIGLIEWACSKRTIIEADTERSRNDTD